MSPFPIMKPGKELERQTWIRNISLGTFLFLQRDQKERNGFQKNTLEVSHFYSDSRAARWCREFSRTPEIEKGNSSQAAETKLEPGWKWRLPMDKSLSPVLPVKTFSRTPMPHDNQFSLRGRSLALTYHLYIPSWGPWTLIYFPSAIVKAMAFPMIMYRYERWTIKKAEHWRIDAFQLWGWRRLLKVLWRARRSKPVNSNGNQLWIFIGRMDAEAEAPILWPPAVKRPIHWKRPWCWERLRAGGEGDDRGWDGWMISLTQWTWVWANSGR